MNGGFNPEDELESLEAVPLETHSTGPQGGAVARLGWQFDRRLAAPRPSRGRAETNANDISLLIQRPAGILVGLGLVRLRLGGGLLDDRVVFGDGLWLG